MPAPERTSLAERMALAASRTAQALRERPGMGGSAPAGTAAPAAAHHAGVQPSLHGGPWQVGGTPGASVVLLPGQMYFGSGVASIRTLLGSCVAITLWHPQRRLGGMCHFLLPSRQRRHDEPPDGRYGDEAVEAMVSALRAARTQPAEYHAHLYGGADTLPEGTAMKFNVGERNIEQGWSLIDRHGFQLQGVDVGEDVPRTVTLWPDRGDVDMKRGQGRAPVHLPAGAAYAPHTAARGA